MKTLSVRQPDAWLLVNGLKDVENRSWDTKHRGLLLIHASSAKPTRADLEYLAEACTDYDLPVPGELPTGGIVGVVSLGDVAAESESEWWDGVSLAWLVTATAPLPFLPCKGKLGLWEYEVPADWTFSIDE